MEEFQRSDESARLEQLINDEATQLYRQAGLEYEGGKTFTLISISVLDIVDNPQATNAMANTFGAADIRAANAVTKAKTPAAAESIPTPGAISASGADTMRDASKFTAKGASAVKMAEAEVNDLLNDGSNK